MKRTVSIGQDEGRLFARIAFEDTETRETLKAQGYRWDAMNKTWTSRRMEQAQASEAIAALFAQDFYLDEMDGHRTATALESIAFTGTARVTLHRKQTSNWDRPQWAGYDGYHYQPSMESSDENWTYGTAAYMQN